MQGGSWAASTPTGRREGLEPCTSLSSPGHHLISRGPQGAHLLQKSSPSCNQRQSSPVALEMFNFYGKTHLALLLLCRQSGKYFSAVSLARARRDDKMNVHEVPPCFLFSTWGPGPSLRRAPLLPQSAVRLCTEEVYQRAGRLGPAPPPPIRGQGGARAGRMRPQGSLCTELPRVLPCAKARST